MFRNLLVAFDGSAPAVRGLKAALALARDQSAKLHVVHVVDQSGVARSYEGEIYLPPRYVDAAIADLREAGRKVLDKARALAGRQGLTIRTVLIDSEGATTAEAILRAAKKARADVIVLGTHGRRGLRRALLGSDAEEVVREATVPVLIVRAEPREMMRAVAATAAAGGGKRRGRAATTAGSARS